MVDEKVMTVDEVDQLLPQTQCQDCGYSACRPYAEAILKEKAEINRCLPGGDTTIKALSVLLNRRTKPLYKTSSKSNQKYLAVIDEKECIACVKCIDACPVDAIVGAPKQLHSVINQYCTGCELCLPPCPVDCISMIIEQEHAPLPVQPKRSAPFIHISHST